MDSCCISCTAIYTLWICLLPKYIGWRHGIKLVPHVFGQQYMLCTKYEMTLWRTCLAMEELFPAPFVCMDIFIRCMPSNSCSKCGGGRGLGGEGKEERHLESIKTQKCFNHITFNWMKNLIPAVLQQCGIYGKLVMILIYYEFHCTAMQASSEQYFFTLFLPIRSKMQFVDLWNTDNNW